MRSVFTSRFLSLFIHNKSFLSCSRHIHKRTIKEVLGESSSKSEVITTSGWVRSVREYKDVVFMNMTDGSCFQTLQVVSTPDQIPSKPTFGSCVEVKGKVTESKGSSQKVELVADKIHVLGECDPVEYPFKYKKRHVMDYQRQFLHLRSRQPFFTSLLRIRNAATQAMHSYFQSGGFIQVSTPVITSNDTEGAGEVFNVKPVSKGLIDDMLEVSDNSSEYNEEFFNTPTFLTVSGQLHLEVISGSFSKVYTMNPAFRAENARSRHHLCEFCMVEAEQAFITSVEDLCQLMEDLVKTTTTTVLQQCEEDIDFFMSFVAPKQHQKSLSKIVEKPFIRLDYTEAIELLKKEQDRFVYKPQWGNDLQKEHEKWLVTYYEDTPVFVVNYPMSLKPFYARRNEDNETVSAVDLLFPDVGELCGGSLREERYYVLYNTLQQQNMLDTCDWYLDLRKFGSAPHGGFGLGFERYIQALLGIQNIKDTLPFPRHERNCKL